MRFLAAMYLRLSRDDKDVENEKMESGSIANQRELIRTFILENPDIELFDIYTDDGFTGSNFDRPEFKRMIKDMEAGLINCIIVKDLSRFGRDYIEAGEYIQHIFPRFGVRFIAITDNYDSEYADLGESRIILPVKNFINDSYCRDISTKVKSQLEIKRKNGELIAPFAPYGYKKSENNKNKLEIDDYAAQIVRNIFDWKIEGMALSAIAEKLNGLGILSPKAYKNYTGSAYKGGFSKNEKSLWSATAVKRILNNETYLGHLIQGKTKKINYKINKVVNRPKEEWIKIENTQEAIISEQKFDIVQNLLRTDSRVSPATGKYGFFSGLLFCGDCGEQMVRRVNHYKQKEKVHYICSTYNRGDGCRRHGVPENKLREIVSLVVKKYALILWNKKSHGNIFVSCMNSQKKTSAKEKIVFCEKEMERLKEEEKKYYHLGIGLYEDLKEKIITEDDFRRLQKIFLQKEKAAAEAVKKQQAEMKRWLRDEEGVTGGKESGEKDLTEFKEKEMDDFLTREVRKRYFFCNAVKEIIIYEGQRAEVVFYWSDKFVNFNIK